MSRERTHTFAPDRILFDNDTKEDVNTKFGNPLSGPAVGPTSYGISQMLCRFFQCIVYKRHLQKETERKQDFNKRRQQWTYVQNKVLEKQKQKNKKEKRRQNKWSMRKDKKKKSEKEKTLFEFNVNGVKIRIITENIQISTNFSDSILDSGVC